MYRSPFSFITDILFDYLPGYEAMGHKVEEYLGIDCLSLSVVAVMAYFCGGLGINIFIGVYLPDLHEPFTGPFYFFAVLTIILFWGVGRWVRQTIRINTRNKLRVSVFFEVMRVITLIGFPVWLFLWMQNFGNIYGTISMLASFNDFLWTSAWFLIGCTPLPPGSAKGKLWKAIADAISPKVAHA